MCISSINILASYEHGWNVTVGNVTSTAIDVSWLPLKTKSFNSTNIYGYAALCFRNVTSNVLVMNFENASSSNTVLRNPRPYTRYKVKVMALVKDGVTDVLTLKNSEEINIHTPEDGENFQKVLYCYNASV